MNAYRYTDCGLDNVFIHGIQMLKDDAGDEVLTIPNINGLHNAIAQGIVEKDALMVGSELRFLRSEMGMTQAELAVLVHREPLAISRWERGELPIDSNAETLIRLHAIDRLALETSDSVNELSRRSVPRAINNPIAIDGSDTSKYRLVA